MFTNNFPGVSKRCPIYCFILSLIFLFIDTGISYGKNIKGITDDIVKIGLMGDLTGPIADGWIPIADGARSYFEMVNREGGVNGRKIKYFLEDDRYSIPLALSCYKKLIHKDKIFALQAASGVGHTAALIPLVEKEKIPLLGATGEKKFFIPARKYLFSVIPWYMDQAQIVFEYIFKERKYKNPTIVLMHPDTASGKDSRDAVRKLVKLYPVKMYKEVVFSLTAVDYTSELLLIKRYKPDVIYIHGLVVDTASIVNAAYRLGVKTQIIVNQYGCADEVLKITGSKAKGLIGVNCFGVWDDNSSGVKRLRKAALAYNPNIHRRSPYFFQGWIAAIVFYQGLKNAGRNLTREAFLRGLESMRNFNTKGICGIIGFSPKDHKTIDNSRFYIADPQQQKFVPISDWKIVKD